MGDKLIDSCLKPNPASRFSVFKSSARSLFEENGLLPVSMTPSAEVRRRDRTAINRPSGPCREPKAIEKDLNVGLSEWLMNFPPGPCSRDCADRLLANSDLN